MCKAFTQLREAHFKTSRKLDRYRNIIRQVSKTGKGFQIVDEEAYWRIYQIIAQHNSQRPVASSDMASGCCVSSSLINEVDPSQNCHAKGGSEKIEGKERRGGGIAIVFRDDVGYPGCRGEGARADSSHRLIENFEILVKQERRRTSRFNH